MIAPQDRDRAMGNMLKRLKGEEVGSQEYLAIRKNGSIFPINLFANRIMQGNNPVGLSGIVIDITERKRTEEALRGGEERFRRLVESVTDYIYSVKLENGVPVSTSHAPACVSVTGYTSEEYAADSDLWYRMVYEQDKQDVKNLTAKVLSGFDVLPLEHRIIHKNGSIRWVKNTPVLKRDEKGVLIAFDGLIEDITMQKQADEALRESEEIAHVLLNTPSDAAYLFDINRVIIAVNEAGAQRFGKTIDELIGTCADGYFPPDFLESRKEKIDEVIRICKPVHFEDKRSGMHLENSFYPIIDAQGKVSRIAVFSRDITERMRAQEALKRSEDRFRRLAENAVDLIYRYEFIPERHFTYVSPAAITITGYTPEEHYADPDLVIKLVHPADRSKLESITYGKQLPLEPLVLRWIRKDGTVIWTEQRNVPIYDDAGNLTAIEGIARDITDRKRAEDALRQESSFRNNVIKGVTEGLCVCYIVSDYPFLAFTVWNDRMTEITGYTVEEINRLGWYQTMYPDPEVRERVMERMARMRIGDDLHAEEWVITCSDGKKRTLSISTSVLETDTAAVHILMMMQDITERKRADEALRQSESLFKMLVESSPVAIAVFTGPSKKLEYVSFRFTELFGYEQRRYAFNGCVVAARISG